LNNSFSLNIYRSYWCELRLVEKLAVVSLLVYATMQFLSPLFMPVDGHDSPIHLYWIDAFFAQMTQGVLYPRWLPDSFFGFGSPTFYFYPPLPYFTAAILRFILPFLNATAEFHLLGSISTIVSFIGCRKFLRHHRFGSESSILGGLIYAFAPYRFFDLYIRGAFGEHLAFAILPFLFLAADTLIEQPGKQLRRFTSLGILWAMLLMTNIPSAAIAGVAVPVYLLARIPRAHRSRLVKPIAALMLGTLVAAIYLFPVLQFSLYLSSKMTQGQLTGYSTGNGILDLILGKNLMSNRIYCSLMLGAGILFFQRTRRQPEEHSQQSQLLLRGIQVLLGVALLLQLPYITLPIFENVLPFSLIQFTWRWDVIVVLSSAILIAMFWEFRMRKWSIVLMLGWSIGGAILLPFTAAGVHMHYLAKRESSEPGEYLPSTKAGPVALEQLRAHENDRVLTSQDATLQIIDDDSASTNRHLRVQLAHPALATLHLFAWSQWRVYCDNVLLPLGSDSLSRITTPLPAGSHSLRIVLKESSFQKSGILVSLISLLMLILFPMIYSRSSQPNRVLSQNPSERLPSVD
jgi:hypothetical protein